MIYIYLFLLLFSCFAIEATEVFWEPWDETIENDSIIASTQVEQITYPWNFLKVETIKSISYYKKNISTKSISRCPFLVSCSGFAQKAIQKHGFLVGFSMFIDRNMYRENKYSFLNYPLVENNKGVLKLNDSYFLE